MIGMGRTLMLAVLLTPLMFGLAMPAAAAPQASVDDVSPEDGPNTDLIANPPVELEANISTTGGVIVEFRDSRDDLIDSANLVTDGQVTATWDPDIGARSYHVVVTDLNGTLLDITSDQEISITERNPDAPCHEFEVEIADRDIWCAAVGPYLGAMPLVLLGTFVWGSLSLGMFVRTGSPMIPYVLLLLIGGAVSATLSGPVFSLITVFGLAFTGAVPVMLYVKYNR